MKNSFRTAVYTKNLPLLERAIRIAIGIGIAGASLMWSGPSWLKVVLVGNAIVAATTGFLGFCPACYLAGRKLGKAQPEVEKPLH